MDYKAEYVLDPSGPCTSKCIRANKPSENTEVYNTETAAVLSFPVHPVPEGAGTCSDCLLGMSVRAVCSRDTTVTELKPKVLFTSLKYCNVSNSWCFFVVSLKGIIFWGVKEGVNAKSFLACAPLKFKVSFTSDFSERQLRQWILVFSTETASCDT